MKPLAPLLLLLVAVAAASAQSSLDRRSGDWRNLPAAGSMTALPGAASAGGLSFDAHSTSGGSVGSNGGNSAPSAGNGNGVGDFSTTRTHDSKMAIEIQIRNVSSQPATAHFDWFFFAQNIDGGTPFVCDNGGRDVTVGAVAQAREAAASVDITSTVTRTVHRTQTGTGANAQIRSTSSEKKSGARSYGWVVRMFVGGQLARVQASTPTLEQLGRTPRLDSMAKQKPK